jgi:hypothetical protein
MCQLIFCPEQTMTFVEFKKTLLDADISLPKFSRLIKVSDKNLQAYKKKGEVPNTIAVIAKSFAEFHRLGVDYRELVESLDLTAKTKKGVGFAKKTVEKSTEKSSEKPDGKDKKKDPAE